MVRRLQLIGPQIQQIGKIRYRFGNQAEIGLWNLYQLAYLYPLIQEAAPLESILERYQTQYQQAYLEMMQNKLGLFSLKKMISLFRC
jgi:uncharacterized protein YdiU (UPF0061 family)